MGLVLNYHGCWNGGCSEYGEEQHLKKTQEKAHPGQGNSAPSMGRGASEPPAQMVLTLNVGNTGSPWAGVNVSSTWILHCDSQKIALAVHPGEGNSTKLLHSFS